MRKPVIAGNWKMNKNNRDAADFAGSIIPLLEGCGDLDIIVAPQMIALSDITALTEKTNIDVAAQNCSWETKGAFTGETSPASLRAMGCKYVILGHSERRHVFNESSAAVNKKVIAVIENNMQPIVCIGETLPQRESGDTFNLINEQLEIGLAGISKKNIETVMIAYEPVWAIGTGKTATKNQAEEVHLFIRNKINKMFGAKIASSMRIIYGGSAKPDNVADLMSATNIDGALVGGASLVSDSFVSMVKTVNGMI